MPWNFPLWQVMRYAVPALMAGNVAVLKHAPGATGCSLAIEQLFKEAEFPANVFRSLVLENARVAEVIADERIAAVTLTGSTRAGRAVASQSGAVLKKTVLELGGSDPYLVLEDADLQLTVESCATSRLIVKRKGEVRPVVVPCTLLPYDPRFELGHDLAQSSDQIKLNHPHCARFCVLGGGACA